MIKKIAKPLYWLLLALMVFFTVKDVLRLIQ